MKRIVAATDFSTRSQRALRRAGILARKHFAELTLVHVVDDDQPREMVDMDRRGAQMFLEEQINSLTELRGVRCDAVVTIGDAFDGILRTARNVSADIIVMGAHRKSLLRDIFVGTTLERVVRTGPYPVLMVNTDAEHDYRNIIAGVDMSKPSSHAVKTAKSLGLLDDAALTLLHAFAAPAKGRMHIADASSQQIEEHVAAEQNRARAEMHLFLATEGIGGMPMSQRIEEGTAFEVISRITQETSPDLVVIGTHGRSGILKVLMGSVAEEVLRSLDVDILAVPPVR